MPHDVDVSMTRTERHRERRERRVRLAKIALGVVGAAVVLAAGGAGLVWWRHVGRAGSPPPLASVTTSTPLAAAASGASARVEVPDFGGMPLVQARAIAQAAGLGVVVHVLNTLPSDPAQAVRDQQPKAGTVVSAGSPVTLSSGPTGKSVRPSAKRKGHFVVVLDPGHQSRVDTGLEPAAPGSAQLAPRMDAGSNGVTTHLPEYELALQIATNLKSRLEAQGVDVILTRTTDDVALSYAARAAIANAAKADLLVAIHADAGSDTGATGVSTAYPIADRWTRSFAGVSKRAAGIIQGELVAESGANDRGTLARSDVSEFEWLKVPGVLVETGNPGNVVEDRLLSSARYQDQIAQGLGDGIVRFLNGGK